MTATTEAEYKEMRRVGLTWRVLYTPPPSGSPSRLALDLNGELLCRDDSVKADRQGLRYATVDNGQINRYKPKDLKLTYPTGTVFEFTTTIEPRGADCAGVYQAGDIWAIYCPMGDIYHLIGSPSPGGWGNIKSYTPVPKGTVFVIPAT